MGQGSLVLAASNKEILEEDRAISKAGTKRTLPAQSENLPQKCRSLQAESIPSPEN